MYLSFIRAAYGDMSGNEGLWTNAVKANQHGFTGLGLPFVEALPELAKPYKYSPGTSKRVPRLDDLGNEMVGMNGQTIYDKVKDTNAEEWTSKIAKLKEGVQVLCLEKGFSAAAQQPCD